MEGKESFILYKKYLEYFKQLNLEERGQLITLILEYVNDLNPPDPENIMIKTFFQVIKIDLKSDLKRWKEQCETNRINGAKGGAPKGNQNARKEKTSETTERLKNNQTLENQAKQAKQADMICHDMMCNDMIGHDDNITDLTDYSNINYNNTARTRDIKDPINFDEGYYHIVKMLQDNLFIEKNDRYQEESFRQAVKWLNDKFTFNDIYSLTRIFLINYLNNDEIDSGSNEILNKPAYYYTSILDLSKKLNKGGANEKLNNC